jgi:hypothetical protein
MGGSGRRPRGRWSPDGPAGGDLGVVGCCRIAMRDARAGWHGPPPALPRGRVGLDPDPGSLPPPGPPLEAAEDPEGSLSSPAWRSRSSGAFCAPSSCSRGRGSRALHPNASTPYWRTSCPRAPA